MNLSTIRALLRMARRDAWRSKGRSALIIAMILVPIAGVTTADIAIRTASLSQREQLERDIGNADIMLSYNGSMPIFQNEFGAFVNDPSTVATMTELSETTTPQFPSLKNVLPKGTPFVEDSASVVTAKTASGVTSIEYRGLDYGNPIATGILKQLNGRAPQTDAEVSLTKGAQKTLGLHIGDQLQLTNPQRTFQVVGTVENPQNVKGAWIVGKPALQPSTATGSTQYPSWPNKIYAKLQTPITWQQVKDANKSGIAVKSRYLADHPPRRSDVAYYQLPKSWRDPQNTQEIAIGTLIGALVALEICLLAGTAFAVGAKRQRRVFGLMGATGATGKQIAGVVLSGAVVLGVTAAVLGIAVGTGLAMAMRPFIEEIGEGGRWGRFDFRIKEMAAIAALAVGAAVVSAFIPARSASRLEIAAALTDRSGTAKPSRRLSHVGFGLAVLGAGIVAYGAVQRDLNIIFAGTGLTELSLVLTVPALIALIARSGKKLPLMSRIALRDSTRNSSRTTPAVAAIMAAVAGAVTLSTIVLTDAEAQRSQYVPYARPGQVSVVNGSATESQLDQALQTIKPILPTKEGVLIRPLLTVGCTSANTTDEREQACDRQVGVRRTPANACPVSDQETYGQGSRGTGFVLQTDKRCANSASITEGTEEVLRVLLGSAPPEAMNVLKSGGAVVTDTYDINDGHVTLELRQAHSNNADIIQTPTGSVAANVQKPDVLKSSTLPAVLVRREPSNIPGTVVFITAKTAETFGLVPEANKAILDMQRLPTVKEEQKATAALQKINPELGSLLVERGYQNHNKYVLLVLMGLIALLTLLATGITTGLALADGQSDQATLAAIGAGNHMRRLSAGFQSSTVAILGIGLGIIAGVIPGAATAWAKNYIAPNPGSLIPLRHTSVHWLQVIPFQMLVVLLVAIPLLAGLLAGIFTRSKVTLTRRT